MTEQPDAQRPEPIAGTARGPGSKKPKPGEQSPAADAASSKPSPGQSTRSPAKVDAQAKPAQTKKPLPVPSEVEAPSSAPSMAQTLLLGAQPQVSLDLTNCMLGEFRVLRRLGSGGMAQVYLAEQTSLKRNVAIKVMRPDFGHDEVYQQRFEHEAKAAAALNHPNIVQVYNVGEADGVRFIAQEYVLGMNLKQYITKKKPPSAQVAIHLMKQVCAALQVAHNAGVVHRDIKPENIMVTRKHVVKVTDFGLAQLTLAGERVNLTQQNSTMGTPLYMSPEQINESKVDHRADLYSMGVAFYHLVAGHPPFRAESALALAYKHLNEEPPSLKQLRPDLPNKFIEIIHRLLAKKPDQRFPDAKSVLASLRQINLEEPNTEDESIDEPTPSAGWRALLDVPKKTLVAFAVTCVVVYLLAAGIGRDLRRSDPLNAAESSSATSPNK